RVGGEAVGGGYAGCLRQAADQPESRRFVESPEAPAGAGGGEQRPGGWGAGGGAGSEVRVERLRGLRREGAFPLLATFAQVAHGSLALVVAEGVGVERQCLTHPQAQVGEEPQECPVA